MDDHSNTQVDLVDDEFERLGRLAGAELRQPPPADGPGTVLRSAHRRRATVAAVAAGVTVAIVVSGLLVATSRTQDEPAPIATLPPNPVPTAPSPVTVPPMESQTSGGMWPQSTLEEVRAAQDLADAGDSDYTWQLDAKLAADEEPWAAEIFARFIDEELGWEEFIGAFSGSAVYEGVMFIRCAPGQTNPLSPLYADIPAEIGGCAPTIDELTYETVGITVTQPAGRGPSGIWVVDRWEMRQSNYDPNSLWGLLYPEFGRVEQVVPPSEDEVTALLEEFLRARLDGGDAEQYLLREPEESPFEDEPVPLLYATTGGVPYERSEIQRLEGPVWPNGWSEYKVRLVAEDETVVEQRFHVVRHDEQLGLVYGNVYDAFATTEDGQGVTVPPDVEATTDQNVVSHTSSDGEVTVSAPNTWETWFDGKHPATPDVWTGGLWRRGDLFGSGERIEFVDPVAYDAWCAANGGSPLLSAPADAAAIAQQVIADPNFETTAPVAARIGGVDAVSIDVALAPGGRACGVGMIEISRWIHSIGWYPGWRLRLYLVDLPEGMSVQTLAITVVAPEMRFNDVIAETAPIIESIEFHPG